MINFQPSGLSDIKNLRKNYFYDIRLSQELFIEWMIREGECHKIYDEAQEIGYYIISKDHILLEFCLIIEFIPRKEEIFNQILNVHALRKIYCKSFDPVLLSCCQMFQKSSKVIMASFQDYTKGINNIDYGNNLRIRLATEADIPLLLTYESELYRSPEELEYTAKNNMIYIFERDHFLIGCGYMIRILPDRNFHNISMWVNPEFRRQGYATLIVSHLKKLCFGHSYTPVASCDVDNFAAKKTLEKSGLVSKHCIIEFNVQKKIVIKEKRAEYKSGQLFIRF